MFKFNWFYKKNNSGWVLATKVSGSINETTNIAIESITKDWPKNKGYLKIAKSGIEIGIGIDKYSVTMIGHYNLKAEFIYEPEFRVRQYRSKYPQKRKA